MGFINRLQGIGTALAILGSGSVLHAQTLVAYSQDYEGFAGLVGVTIINNTLGIGFANPGPLPFGADPGGADAFLPLNAGSGVQFVAFKGPAGGVDSITFDNVKFQVPADINFSAANLTFDYAYQANTDSAQPAGAFTITVSGINGDVVAFDLAPTASAAASGTISASLLELFRTHAGEELTLILTASQAAAEFPNRYLNFALDNIFVTYSISSGGGSGASAAAVANQNANRRAQQQLQAHQARVARQQVAQQHRRNQQRR